MHDFITGLLRIYTATMFPMTPNSPTRVIKTPLTQKSKSLIFTLLLFKCVFTKKLVQLRVMIYAMIFSDLASCDVECGNFHQAESCKKCVENESPMIKMLMPYSWCGGECKWEPVMGLCIGKHT